MKTSVHNLLQEEYTAALKSYLARPGEEGLHSAYAVGRRALAEELGPLEMAMLHHDALLGLLPSDSADETMQVVKEAKNFFVESLTPFEMAYRGFHDATSALRRLNEKLEDEAKRIAHSIHDEAGQFLACVHIALEEVARELPPNSRKHLEEIRELLNQVEGQLRRLSHELRPTILDDLGLLPALEFLAEGVSKRSGVPIVVEGERGGRLLPSIETAFYRAVQEALTNATKHAQAKSITVRIKREEKSVACSVRDDGVGFDTSAMLARKGNRGLGLLGIRERVATLGGSVHIKSQPGQGTEITITVPVES
ncbi:MAG TPA: ATP-binding protein [Pyrinomonadaceae bacterium]|jgi:signal transduction histidine kinase|nr:ATP-binding protein [Pyrinomonadaceae bacterium]